MSEDARAVERFTAVLGASDIPSLLVLDDRVVAANDAALGLFGAAPTGRSGRSALGLDDAAWTELIDPVLAGTVTSARRRVTLDLGAGATHASVSVTGVRREAEGDGYLEFAAILQVAVEPVDGPHLARAESALRQSEDRFRRTFEGAPIGMALVAPDGGWIEVNDALCEMLGRRPDELRDLTFQDLTHPDDIDADMALLRETLAGTRNGYTLEKRYLHADGSVVWGLLTVALLRDDDGEPLYFVSQIADVTERNRLDAELERARHQLESVVARAPIPMAVVDGAAVIELVNAQFGSVFGDHVTVGRDLTTSLLTPGARDELDAVFDALLGGEVDEATVEVAVPGDGHEPTWLRLDVALLAPRPDPRFIVQAIDVSADRRVRSELERAALHDPLTGLRNRRGFALDLHRAANGPGEELAVVYLDLDGFKAVNDAEGHDAGDAVLLAVAEALRAAIRDTDVAARLGGDEFVVLCADLAPEKAEGVAQRIAGAIAELAPGVSASIGVATSAEYGCDVDGLLRHADRLMLDAKRRHRIRPAQGGRTAAAREGTG